MTAEQQEFCDECAKLDDDIASGVAMILRDEYAITLPPEAEKRVGRLVMLNTPKIVSLMIEGSKKISQRPPT